MLPEGVRKQENERSIIVSTITEREHSFSSWPYLNPKALSARKELSASTTEDMFVENSAIPGQLMQSASVAESERKPVAVRAIDSD